MALREQVSLDILSLVVAVADNPRVASEQATTILYPLAEYQSVAEAYGYAVQKNPGGLWEWVRNGWTNESEISIYAYDTEYEAWIKACQNAHTKHGAAMPPRYRVGSICLITEERADEIDRFGDMLFDSHGNLTIKMPHRIDRNFSGRIVMCRAGDPIT